MDSNSSKPHERSSIVCRGTVIFVFPNFRLIAASYSNWQVKSLFLGSTSSCNPQDKVDNDRSQQSNGQYGWTESVVEAALASLANAPCSPVECEQRVYHGCHCNEREESSTDLSDLITKVEETDGQTTQDNGKVEPGEKGSLIGEKDLGLDTGWKGNPLA